MSDPRRLSLLPKSILKQKFKDDDTTGNSQNLTMSQIQFPTQGLSKEEILDGNNTTSRINASFSKGNRRVSFAPDVTLHKFDFIPQSIQNVREPRRKSALTVEVPINHDLSGERKDTSDSGETMEFTSPIGSIFQTTEPSDESKNDSYQPIFDKEVSMDITQLFAKHSAKPDDDTKDEENIENNIQKPKDTEEKIEYGNGNEDKNLNEKQNTNSVVTEISNVETKVLDETMDLTIPRRQLRTNEEESMEFTEQILVNTAEFGTQPSEATQTIKKSTPPAPEETMEFTNLQAPLELRPSQVVSSTQLEAPLPSAKRRKLSNGSYQSPVKNQIASREEEKENFDSDFADMERLSPIPITTDAAPNQAKPLDHPTTLSTEKEYQAATQSQVEPIALETFFEETGVKFDVENTIDELKIKFSSTEEIETVPSNILHQALYYNIPILEIQAFTAKELNRRIIQSKMLLKSLQDQIASNAPPRLIKEYFDSDKEIRNIADKKLQLVTIMSRLQSEKVWFEWRSQHLKGIKTVLEENMAILLDENAQIMKYMNEINDIKMRVCDIKHVLLKEIDILGKHNESFDETNEQVSVLLKVNKLKEDLKENMLKIADLSKLTAKKDQLTDRIQTIREQINKVNEETHELQKELRHNKVCTSYEVEKLKRNFSLYQNISGIKFKSIRGSILTTSLYNSKITVSIDLSKLDQPSCISFKIQEEGISESEMAFINCWIVSCKNNFSNGINSVCFLQKQLTNLLNVFSEFEKLKLMFSTFIKSEPENDKTIKIQPFDCKYHCKLSLSIPIEHFFDIVCNSKKVTIKANILYGDDRTAREITDNFVKRYEKAFGWLSNCNLVVY